LYRMRTSSMTNPKTVYLLVGPKGSGKTYIGGLLEQALGVHFLRVERLLIDHIKAAGLDSDQLPGDGYHLEEEAIDRILQNNGEVISEATGSSKHLPSFIERLRNKYTVVLIRVVCPLHACLERVDARSPADHFEISDEAIMAINRKSQSLSLDWDLEIDNTAPATDENICARFREVRKRSSSARHGPTEAPDGHR